VSAIAGCVWRHERPACADDLAESMAAARARARAPFRVRCAGPIALAFADARQPDRQPVHDSASGLTVIVDGDVDNAAELADALGEDDRSACAVVLAAWRRWGVEAGAHLLGDYLVVISDEPQRRVTCLRSPFGQRPIFYTAAPHLVVFGSEAQQVVRHPAVRTTLNEGMVAEFLAWDLSTVHETFWRDVRRLPPAHALEITDGGTRVRRFWDFDPEARLRCASDDEYAERFLDVFTRAVECCLADVRRPSLMLSGGIDSSAVAAVGQELLERRGGRLHAFTLSFPGRACDETPYSHAVADRFGLPTTVVEAVPPSSAELVRLSRHYLDVPDPPNGLMCGLLRERAAAEHVGVLLTGFGGDDFFTGDPPVELLRRGRVIAWVRALVSARLSERGRDALRPVFGARLPRRPWIVPSFAARTDLRDRLRRSPALPFPTKEQQDIHRTANSLDPILGDEMEDRAAQAAGILQRHPFYDRRVAEFGMAIPPSQRGRRREIKLPIRHALRNRLPPLVASRVSIADKAEFSSTFVEAFESLGGARLFVDLRSERAGWVDGGVVRRMYEEMIALYSTRDDRYIASAGPLWAVVALEHLLDASEHIGTRTQ
jgi:asparagine synthase (glutamine-hydrolysing)